jgi:hypothetical protein
MWSGWCRVGEAADLANAAWYAAEGDYANAALAAAAAVPFVGWGAGAIKAGQYIYKGVDAARSGSRYADEAADVARRCSGARSGSGAAYGGGRVGCRTAAPGPTAASTCRPTSVINRSITPAVW